MKRRKINPLFLVAGIVVIIIGFVIFVPALLGAASETYNLERYNNTGPVGNSTVVMMSGISGLFAMLSGTPLVMLAMGTSIVILALVFISVLRK